MTEPRERPPTYGQRELQYLGVMRVVAAPIFAGLNAIAGDPFPPALIAIILLAVPYGLATIWLAGSDRWQRIDPRVYIVPDLVVMGLAMLVGEGPSSQAAVIFYIWTIGMSLVHPPRRVIWCALGAIVSISVASIPAIADDPGEAEQLFIVDMIVLWVGFLTWCCADVFRRRAEDIERLSTTRRRLLADVLGAEERARQRLSDSLQNDALQVLLTAGQDLDAGTRGRHPWIASRARERIRLAVRSLRETVRTLHPAAIAEAGVAAAVDAVAERAAVGNGVRADVRVDPEVAGINDALLVSLTRELSLDAASQAHGREIGVVAGRVDGHVELAVTGSGIDPAAVEASIAAGNSTLASSRERVEAAGGTLVVEPAGDAGSRVVARIPARDEERAARSRSYTYGQRELRYLAVVRVASMPLFSILNAVAGTPLDGPFVAASILSLVYGVALLWFAYSPYWDRIDARWFGALDLLCLGLAITVTGGPESQLRAVFFVYPIALSMLFPPRVVIAFALGAMASFAVFSLPEVLGGGAEELRALGTFELSFVWINMMSWFVAASFWDRAIRIGRLSRLRQRLLAEALDAEDRARRRLSQSLHDDALQVLLASGQDLDQGLRGDAKMLERARDELRQAIHRLQEVIRGLDPSAIEYGGLGGGIDAAVEEWAARGGFSADVRVDAAATGSQDALVFTVVRELVSNAAKHSEASEFSVEVARMGDELHIEAADDGRGMSRERPGTAVREGHIGLASCRERIEMAGGSLAIESAPSAGTRVSIVLPDPAPPSAPEPATAASPEEYAAAAP